MASKPASKESLHGNAPDQCKVALLIIDILTDLDFPGSEELIAQSVALARNIAGLSRACRKRGVPVIYVNDNRGRWRSDSGTVIKAALRPGSPGRKLAKRLLPRKHDYIVLKPKHSPFYATPLDTLLQYLGTRTLIITGIATESCVLVAATEAHMRDLKLIVPADCVAGLTAKDHSQAVELMRRNFQADTPEWKAIKWSRLRR
jgi:nicotinamidase-related amidase